MGIFKAALRIVDNPVTRVAAHGLSAVGEVEKKLAHSKPVVATTEWIGKRADSVARHIAHETVDQLASLVEMPKLTEEDLSLGLSKKGRLAAAGIAVAGAAYSGYNQYQNYAMGDKAVYGTPTPSIQPYMMKQLPNDISAGATGDLVFALNANNQNGFIG